MNYSKENDHVFTVDLTGLDLKEDHLKRIAIVIQGAVTSELAAINFRPSGGILVDVFKPGIQGKWFIKDLQRFDQLRDQVI